MEKGDEMVNGILNRIGGKLINNIGLGSEKNFGIVFVIKYKAYKGG